MTPPITATEWRIGPPRERGEITVQSMLGDGGIIRYAVRRDRSIHWALNKSGKWEHEPLPSSRDDEYFARCRWDDWEEAARAAIRAFEAEASR